MELEKKPNNTPIRRQIKAGLLNQDFIKAYIEEYGKPNCFCCGKELEVFMPAMYFNFIRIYCVNCHITTRAVGTCRHDKEYKRYYMGD